MYILIRFVSQLNGVSTVKLPLAGQKEADTSVKKVKRKRCNYATVGVRLREFSHFTKWRNLKWMIIDNNPFNSINNPSHRIEEQRVYAALLKLIKYEYISNQRILFLRISNLSLKERVKETERDQGSHLIIELNNPLEVATFCHRWSNIGPNKQLICWSFVICH